MLALCDAARVPVTPAGGRSGVCGASVPLFGGVALDLCGLAGIGDVDATSLVADLRAGTFGPDVESGLRDGHGLTLGHWPQSMDLSTVGGWLACRGAGPVLQPLREDRGHGARPRSGAGRRPRRPHRGHGATLGHRSRPHPALRGQRGHPRGDHRGPVPGPPGARGRGAAGLRIRHVRRRTRRLPADPAPGRHPGRPPPLRHHRVGPLLRPARTPTCSSSSTRPTRPWSAPRSPWSTRSARAATRLDIGTGRPVARPPQRRVRPRPAVAVGRRRRHRRGRRPGGRHCPASTGACSTPWPESTGTLVASSHQSHAYTDGACLYFTFAGRPPDGRDRRPDAGRLDRRLLPPGLGRGHPGHHRRRRCHQPPPRHRTQPGPVPGRRAREPRSRCWPRSRRPSTPTASSTPASSACPPPFGPVPWP